MTVPKLLERIRKGVTSWKKPPPDDQGQRSSGGAVSSPDGVELAADPDPGRREAGFDFNGAWLKNAHRMTARKSIVIFGAPRGGTSFAASVFAQLGVPFSRTGEKRIGRRYEHRDLKTAFAAKDRDALRRIADEFSAEHEVWAWKLPNIRNDIGFVAELVPNPHFVLIFKEPPSVAARKNDVHGRDTLGAMESVLAVYRQMTQLMKATEHPLMAISYDRAMARMEPFLRDVASFTGVERYDFEKVQEGIRRDGVRYLASPGLQAARAEARGARS